MREDCAGGPYASLWVSRARSIQRQPSLLPLKNSKLQKQSMQTISCVRYSKVCKFINKTRSLGRDFLFVCCAVAAAAGRRN